MPMRMWSHPAHRRCSQKSSAPRFRQTRIDPMLNAIVRFSLRFRGVVLSLALASLGYGLYTLTQAKYAVFPEFAPPRVSIQTEAPRLSPEQVQLLVTQPIEHAINGVTGIESLRSNSIQGLSVITVTFHTGHNVYLERQLVAERVSVLAGKVSSRAKTPVLAPLNSSAENFVVGGFTGRRTVRRPL